MLGAAAVPAVVFADEAAAPAAPAVSEGPPTDWGLTKQYYPVRNANKVWGNGSFVVNPVAVVALPCCTCRPSFFFFGRICGPRRAPSVVVKLKATRSRPAKEVDRLDARCIAAEAMVALRGTCKVVIGGAIMMG